MQLIWLAVVSSVCGAVLFAGRHILELGGNNAIVGELFSWLLSVMETVLSLGFID